MNLAECVTRLRPVHESRIMCSSCRLATERENERCVKLLERLASERERRIPDGNVKGTVVLRAAAAEIDRTCPPKEERGD